MSALAPYCYRAVVDRVIDGDTLTATIDLGFGVWIHEQSLRLLGINAREKSDQGGQEALRNLATLLPVGTQITLQSVKPDKFGGRYDAYVQLADGSDLSRRLIQTQWAASWDGRGPKVVPPWPRTIT